MERYADEGYTKALGALGAVTELDGLAVGKHAVSVEFMASLATEDSHDDLTDHHDQFAAAFDEGVMTR